MTNHRQDDFGYDDEMLRSVNRYENMLKSHSSCFFDVHEFEDIIDYYLDTEDFSQAAQVADYATRIYPSAASIQIRMAEILIDKGQPVEAMRILNVLEQLESGECDIYLLKGAAFNMMGKPKDAHRQFEKAISLADENREEVLYNIGISFERINQHKVALKYFMKVHAMDPDNYYVYYDLAYCYERIDNLEKSVHFYQKYLDEDPFSEHVWYNLGIVYNKMDENEKALEAYDFAIAINENYSSAHFNKANTLTLLDRYREATDAYLTFLEIEPDSAAACCYLGECYERQDDFEQASIYYHRSLSIDSKFADAWFGLSVMKSRAGNHQESIHDVLKAVEIDGDNPEYLFVLATEYTALRLFDKAVETFRQLTHLITTDAMTWDCFAKVYLEQGDLDAAYSVVTEGLCSIPDSALLLYRMAAFCFLTGDRRQGLEMLEKALSISASDIDTFYDTFKFAATDKEIQKLIKKYQQNTIIR